MTIPEVRDALQAIVFSLRLKGNCNDEARGLAVLIEELKRRPPVRQTAPKARTSTAKLRREIRAYAKLHPDLANREIGLVFNVDGGRVSEALAGFRR